MRIGYTKKQAALLRLFAEGKLHRYTILSGSVRSGKTWISLVIWAFWVATRPKDGVYMMAGKTIEALDRNCLRPLQAIVGRRNFQYNAKAKRGTLFGRTVYFEGCNDVRAENKIRGLTLYGAYCDELTLFTEDFFAQLLARLSAPGAKLIATTNPDTPMHWLYKNYINRSKDAQPIDLGVYTFLLDDNTTLDPEYVEEIKRDYEGVFYQRMILGLWVVAEGVIYRVYSDRREDCTVHLAPLDADGNEIRGDGCADYDYIQLGLDFGGNGSAHSITATGLKYDYSKITVLASRRLPAKDTNPIQLYEWVEKFVQYVRATYCRGSRIIQALYADSAEQTLKNGLKDRLDFPVKDSLKREIVDRIRTTTALMSSGRFFIVLEDCETLDAALQTAVWNEKKLDHDERLDNGTSDIDSLDSFEYSFEKDLKKYARSVA